MITQPERCRFTWKDGWGTHQCAVLTSVEHPRNHGCLCDARTPVIESDTTDKVQEGSSA